MPLFAPITRILLLIVPLAAGCSVAPPRIAETPTGRPEVTIAEVEIEAVNNELINRMQNDQWLLEEQSANMLLFSKEITGGDAGWARLITGGSSPVGEVRYTLTETQVGVRVVAALYISAQLSNGADKRDDMNGNNNFWNGAQGILQATKAHFEIASN